MSDLIIWARVVEEAPNQFMVVVSSSAVTDGDERSATDVRVSEATSYREALKQSDTIVAAMTEAIEGRGHRVAKVERLRL